MWIVVAIQWELQLVHARASIGKFKREQGTTPEPIEMPTEPGLDLALASMDELKPQQIVTPEPIEMPTEPGVVLELAMVAMHEP